VSGSGPVMSDLRAESASSLNINVLLFLYKLIKSITFILSRDRIVSVTHEAKRLGVSRSATPHIRQVREVCPTIIVFSKPNVWGKQDTKKPRHGTWQILDTIREFCATRALGNDVIVELASSDEVYLDISSEVTRAMERLHKTRKTSISISKDIVHENGRRSRQGPFEYHLRTVSSHKML